MNLLKNEALLDRLAAGYALGTLRGGARRRFEDVARQSVAARTRVLLWQEHFAALTELEPEQAPGPNAWKRIANAVAAEPVPEAGTSVLERLRRHLALWRTAAMAAALAAVAAVSVTVHLMERPDIAYVAVLQDSAQAASVLVTFDPARQTLTLKRVGPFSEGPDRSLQLWALPPGQAPRSLGVLPASQVVKLDAAPAELSRVPALAISLEPKGGVPAGSGPTGPVLFKGALLQTNT